MKTRWRIRGRFTTTAPLHVGSGDNTMHSQILNKKKESCEIAAVVRDHGGKPCIPGTTIKGVLRTWADRFFPGDAAGTAASRPRNISASLAEAGWAEFCTAFVDPQPSSDQLDRFARNLPYWHQSA